ncbi:response regulator transcription factor [Streptococcus ovis]|uniref:response regulator transcription factor n=1 Tax=Streptococcus ovis TaxID=82806 RepID=UPI0003650C3E|nr:response regulator transcription factor [Streptococcus ovis]
MKLTDRKLLILDDNPDILQLVKESLAIAGFTQLITASSKKEALDLLQTQAFDMAILDIMLPDGSGFDVLRHIRQVSMMPALFLSAVSDIEKQYQGFELGADDYIVKPFRPKELELRILSILKRSYPQQADIVQLESCQIDFERAAIVKAGEEILLTAKEFSLLRVLYDHKNKIVTFDNLLSKVWGEQYEGYENTLMAHIRKVRQKIETNPSKPTHLLTVKGLGYQLRVD